MGSLESALLHLIIEGEHAEAERRIFTEMLPGEQLALAMQADALAHLCRRPARVRQALAEGCRWQRHCPNTAAAYHRSTRGENTSSYDDFRGICAQHRPEAEEHGFIVLDAPAQVRL